MKVLDHGYVTLVESWGNDERIIEAARMSTDKGFLGWGPNVCKHCKMRPDDFRAKDSCYNGPHEFTPGDEKLLAYLYRHKHMTPFEMAGMIIEVQAPIFVFREWHRHRTQSYNEMSARYIPLPDVNYMPTTERLMLNAGERNRQASSHQGMMCEANADVFQKQLDQAYYQAQSVYSAALSNGVPKELARLILPVGRYSRMRASANLRNWLQFLTLRMDVAAQWEIQQYANAVAELISNKFPRTYELFKS